MIETNIETNYKLDRQNLMKPQIQTREQIISNRSREEILNLTRGWENINIRASEREMNLRFENK